MCEQPGGTTAVPGRTRPADGNGAARSATGGAVSRATDRYH